MENNYEQLLKQVFCKNPAANPGYFGWTEHCPEAAEAVASELARREDAAKKEGFELALKMAIKLQCKHPGYVYIAAIRDEFYRQEAPDVP